MLIFWEQRLVFLATPKTGSTAIEAALESLASVSVQRPPEIKHTPAYRYRRFLAPYLHNSADGASFTVVALMREPVDWLRSWYRFRQRDDVQDPARSTRGISFEQFAADYMKQPQPPHAQVGAQARFLSGPDGLGVDRLFCYERLDSFLGFLEDRLDCEIILPRLNTSPPAEVSISEQMERRLRDHMRDDIRLYETVSCATA